MTNADYLPGNGTHAAFAVAYLHSLPAGVEIGSATIAEACDIGISLLINTTGASVAAGLIECKKFGSRYAWRAGQRAVPREFIEAHPPKRQVDVRPFVPPASAMPQAASTRMHSPEPLRRMTERFIDTGTEDAGRSLTPAEIAALGLKAFGAEPAADEVVATISAPPPLQTEPPIRRRAPVAEAARAMRVGIFSDGAICIERAGRVETYTPAEAEELMRFFTRFLLRGVEQA